MLQMITRNDAPVQGHWQKELANAVKDPQQLVKMLELDEAQLEAGFAARKDFPMLVPLPFVAKMEKGNPRDPLLLQVMPQASELIKQAGFSKDPLLEHDTAAPGLLHKYKSRVLFILKAGCAVNCRYCFRRHFPYQDNSPNKQGWQQAIDYIAAHSEINEVIFSGGDPLMAKDSQLLWLTEQLAEIQHLKRLRLHTRLPVVLPNRLTAELLGLLSNNRLKTIMVLHINHANEVDNNLLQKLEPFHLSGTTLLNQSVLLKGVNDSLTALTELSEALFGANILPYYLHQLDKVQGAAHFEVSDKQAGLLMQGLLAELPGFLVPKLVREVGGESSKTPINFTGE